MPWEEWKRKHQKEPIKGSKRGPKCSAGPLKEAAKSSARSVEKTARTNLDEHHNIENELLNLVAQLKNRRRINGKPCTLNELLDPEEEQEIGENTYAFEGGDADIVGFVQEEMVGDIERSTLMMRIPMWRPHLSRRCLICVRLSMRTVWLYVRRVHWRL